MIYFNNSSLYVSDNTKNYLILFMRGLYLLANINKIIRHYFV